MGMQKLNQNIVKQLYDNRLWLVIAARLSGKELIKAGP